MDDKWALSVTELNEYVRRKLAGDAVLRAVAVRGEISGFKRYASGHCYFALKDEASRVACVIWSAAGRSLDFPPGGRHARDGARRGLAVCARAAAISSMSIPCGPRVRATSICALRR